MNWSAKIYRIFSYICEFGVKNLSQKQISINCNIYIHIINLYMCHVKHVFNFRSD